ncbi:hypothetical protein GCM10023206_06720 [Acinetobacter puyangensis]|uniref:Uncharacterized protein n=1 Tax=Acinetobacter puyangensis TaxID=1096779 RepID=A0A240E7Q8_9GAMM|nr:DUF4435 domain-containing protein [Acinetobacter puyangensis]SNX44249.1 Protein of unknown function [Acinetobacter puyangensis]
MSDFIKYLTNPNYIGAYNASKEGNKDAAEKGIVYIEDDSDQVFWEKFINSYFPNKYNVQASIADRPGERGKRALEKLYTDANIKALCAVDADYDLICPDSNIPYSQDVINNKFVIHTFGFSRESALLDKHHLNNFFKSIKYTIEHNIDIDSFIKKLSILTFKGLVHFSHELNSGNKLGLIADEFHNCFNILDKQIVKDDLTLDESLMQIIDSNLNNYFSQLVFSENDLNESKKYLFDLDINESNSYRFISGHTMYNLVKKIHNQLLDTLFSMELIKIKSEYEGQAINDRIKQFKNTFKMQSAIETFCQCYPIQTDDEIHSRISKLVSEIAS